MGMVKRKDIFKNIIIFTDLDDVLLDHDDYTWDGAEKALELIKKHHIPLIFCTSKTFHEVKMLQLDMSICEPFIVENGGGIFFPEKYRDFIIEEAILLHGYKCIPLGEFHTKILSFIRSLRADISIKCLSEMKLEEIMFRTGLSASQAELATRREFSEPFIMDNENELPELEKLADTHGLKITEGGKFYHLIGKNTDKGLAVRIVLDIFRRNLKSAILSYGLGDSPNDLPMLLNVDIPILFPQKNGQYKKIGVPNLIRAKKYASHGWSEIICSIIDGSGRFRSEKHKQSF